MKCKLLILALAVFAILPLSVQAKDTPTTHCLSSLSWQRDGYTKAHVNVTQSIQQRQPLSTNWSNPRTQRQCRSAVESARGLRVKEQNHWSILRLHKKGIKWIIRKQFASAGRRIVLAAWQVVSCESSFHPFEVSSTDDTGTWQINWVHHEPLRVMDSPELSTAWAWRASDHGKHFSPTWRCAVIYHIA